MYNLWLKVNVPEFPKFEEKILMKENFSEKCKRQVLLHINILVNNHHLSFKNSDL